jgi:hypothetical protein
MVVSSTLLFGGRPEGTVPDSYTISGDSWAALFGQLSWKYTKTKHEWSPYSLPDPRNREALREQIAPWAGRVWFHLNEVPKGEYLRSFDLFSLEKPFRSYIERYGGDIFNRGASVEEIWCSQQLYSSKPYVLMLSERFRHIKADRVEPKKVDSPDTLVWILAALCDAWTVRLPEGKDLGFNVLVNGGDSGHTIYISGLNGSDFIHPRGSLVRRGWFSFQDPWPARSLLVQEQQYKDIRVLEDITRPHSWLISPEDLSKILVGFLLSIDLLPVLSGYMKVLDDLKFAHKGTNIPLWNENPREPKLLFPILLGSRGGMTAMARTQSGLGSFVALVERYLMNPSRGANIPGPRDPRTWSAWHSKLYPDGKSRFLFPAAKLR